MECDESFTDKREFKIKIPWSLDDSDDVQVN